jgi:hypothetical protein
VGDRLTVDFDAWQDHAAWWDGEAEAARARMYVDDADIEAARHAFGKIGTSTVGAAYAETLQARRDCGQRLGDTAASIAANIRRDLQTYADQESENARMLGG